MKRKWMLGIAAVVLVAAVFAGGFFSGRWSAGNREDQEENWDNFTDDDDYDFMMPPVSVKIIGKVRETDGTGSGICLLDVTAVYSSVAGGYIDIKEDSDLSKATVRLIDGSSWDFSPGEALAFRYYWYEKGVPEVGQMVSLTYINVFPDGPMLIGQGEMRSATEEELGNS